MSYRLMRMIIDVTPIFLHALAHQESRNVMTLRHQYSSLIHLATSRRASPGAAGIIIE